MASVKQLQAVARDRVGKGAARAVRREGHVPAVIYGGGAAAEPIALDFNETPQLIFAGHFLTTSSRSTSTARRSAPSRATTSSTRSRTCRSMSTSCASPKASGSRSRCRCTSSTRRPRPASSAAAAQHRAPHDRAAGAGRRHPGSRSTVDLTGLDIGDFVHISASRCRKACSRRSASATSPIATIVAAVAALEGRGRRQAASGCRRGSGRRPSRRRARLPTAAGRGAGQEPARFASVRDGRRTLRSSGPERLRSWRSAPCVSSSASAIRARATPATATISASWRSTRSPARHGFAPWRRALPGRDRRRRRSAASRCCS